MPEKSPELARANPPQFSGKPEDFASFLKRIESLVVPGAEKNEIRCILKNAMPREYRHLLESVPSEDYEEMLEILKGKFGDPRVVGDSQVKASSSCLGIKTSHSLDGETAPNLEPVLLQVMHVRGTNKAVYGSLKDLGCTDHFVTNKAAAKNKLKGVPVELMMNGIGAGERVGTIFQANA